MMKRLLFQKSPTFLKEGAIFIADSHYCDRDKTLLKLLQKIERGEIYTPQLFLVGDIFQLLLNFDYLIEKNRDVIELINSLSEKIEVFYFEGNHDFNLKGIFSSRVILLKKLKKEGICINHGDIYLDDKFYIFYSKIVRNSFFLNMLHIVTFNFVNNWLFKKLLEKPIRCNRIDNFEELAKKKIELYRKEGCELIIEGHYHQNRFYKNYLNLPSLFCEKAYMRFKKGGFETIYLERSSNS